MKKVLLIVLLLTACDSPSVEKIIMPDGKMGVVVECGWNGTPSCYKGISSVCKNGYVIQEHSSWTYMVAECN